MPFTFSHPGAVLPLGYLPKRFVSMTGLVIGSMAPDFEYFFRMSANSYYSHTWAGLVWFDLPLTIILAFIFHEIIRNKLIDNLPAILAKKLIVFKRFNWKKYFRGNFIVVILSTMVGTATHILWDGFTHSHRHFVREIGKLKEFFIVDGYHVSTYIFLQVGSSIIGGLIVLFVLFRLPSDKTFIRQRSILPFWISVVLIATTVILIKLYFGSGYDESRSLIMTTISGGLIGLFITSLLLPTIQKKYTDN